MSGEIGVENIWNNGWTLHKIHMVKDINLQTQESQQTPNRIISKKTMSKSIIIKLLKIKDFLNTLEKKSVKQMPQYI